MKYLPLLWAGLWRKPLRTVFTLVSVIAAFLLFGLLQGVSSAFDRALGDAHVNRLYVYSRVSLIDPIPVAHEQRIARVPGVSGVASLCWFGGYYQDPKDPVVSYPVDVQEFFTLFPEWQVPRDQLEAMARTRTGAIVGTQLAQKYGWKIGDRVPLRTPIWSKADGTTDWSFDIVGFYQDVSGNGQNSNFIFNYEYFDEARGPGKGRVSMVIVGVADPTRSAQVAGAIDALFANSPDETKSQSEKEYARAQIKQIGDINFIVTSIVGAVFFTLLFLTGNTMMQSVRERIPEFAVLKTLGFGDGAVLALVLAESLLLCLVAAGLGLAGAAALFPLTSQFLEIPTIPPVVLVQGLVWAVLLALVSGAAPAWRVRRLSIVDALAGR